MEWVYYFLATSAGAICGTLIGSVIDRKFWGKHDTADENGQLGAWPPSGYLPEEREHDDKANS